MGPIDRMRTTYMSDPPLPPVDVINLLLTGRTTEAAAKSPATPQSLLAWQMAGQVSSRVEAGGHLGAHHRSADGGKRD